ncbi:MAG: porin [Gemmatales bacterium]
MKPVSIDNFGTQIQRAVTLAIPLLLILPGSALLAQTPEKVPVVTVTDNPPLASAVLQTQPCTVDEGSSRRIPLQAYWDHGFRFESENKKFDFHFGGTGNIDFVNPYGPTDLFLGPNGAANGVENAQALFLRRAVLQAEGRIYDRFDFSIQFDFANASNDNNGEQPASFGNLTSSPAPQNIWLQMRDVPYLGYVRIGQQKKPIGMENNTGAMALPFMERSDNMDAFYGPFDGGFALGATSHSWNASETVTWKYGIFQPTNDVYGVAFNDYTVGGRLTALPWYEEDGAKLVHLGLGYWGGELVQNQLRDRVRPLLRNGPGFAVPILADTSEIPGGNQYTVGPEFALQWGPFMLQAEYAVQWLTEAVDTSGQNVGTVIFHGGYIEALYFLTGEHQSYDRREGVFGRVIPHEDYLSSDTSWGAWQVGLRYSFVDLDDKTIQGGQLHSWTAGINWYLNPNMRLQFNYLAEFRDMPGVPTGWLYGVGLRAGFEF